MSVDATMPCRCVHEIAQKNAISVVYINNTLNFHFSNLLRQVKFEYNLPVK